MATENLFSSLFKGRRSLVLIGVPRPTWLSKVRSYSEPGSPGSGAGKGGGAGGSIKEAGGAMGQLGAAREEEFFYRKTKADLEKIREKMVKAEKKDKK